jgi:hypothetical protein
MERMFGAPYVTLKQQLGAKSVSAATFLRYNRLFTTFLIVSRPTQP